MDNATRVVIDIFKQEVANQIEAKVINEANVKTLKALLEVSNKEKEQYKNELECLKTDMNCLKEEIAQLRDAHENTMSAETIIEATAVEVE